MKGEVRLEVLAVLHITVQVLSLNVSYVIIFESNCPLCPIKLTSRQQMVLCLNYNCITSLKDMLNINS